MIYLLNFFSDDLLFKSNLRNFIKWESELERGISKRYAKIFDVIEKTLTRIPRFNNATGQERNQANKNWGTKYSKRVLLRQSEYLIGYVT